MSYHTLLHQFEIRYTNILDFPHSVNSILSPFTRLASSVTISNENSRRERIIFSFSDDFCSISINWDKMVIRSQNLLELSIENNTLMEQVFFNVFKKISSIDSFGEIKNFFHYTVALKPDENDNRESSLNTLKGRFIKKEALDISTDLNKFALVMATGSTTDVDYNEIRLENFTGQENLERRNIELVNPDILELMHKSGILIELKYLNKDTQLNFPRYKKITKKVIKKIESI